MRLATIMISASLALFSTACGSEIGDSCSFASDCSPSGDRICDTESPGGYCTVFGCDHDTCPDGSTCVRFFSVRITNLPCDPATEDISTNDCTNDELCTLGGTCVPKLAESRFCMKDCGGDGDCRDAYECRTRDLMELHGGEPVPPPGELSVNHIQAFCAPSPDI